MIPPFRTTAPLVNEYFDLKSHKITVLECANGIKLVHPDGRQAVITMSEMLAEAHGIGAVYGQLTKDVRAVLKAWEAAHPRDYNYLCWQVA